MSERQPEKIMVRQRKHAGIGPRAGRVIWLSAAVIFLSLAAIVIWMWAHSKAVPSANDRPRGVAEPMSEDTDITWAEPEPPVSPTSGAGKAVGWRSPSPFRLPDTEEELETETDHLPEKNPKPDTSEGELIYHGRRNDRMEIALSFDDGPHPYYTPLILDILAEYGIRATFFMVGENVGYYPAAAEAVVAAGHEVGNHTFTHRRFNLMNEHEMLAEISACEDAIASVSDRRPHFIRPPEGCLNDTMRRVIGSLDYRIVLWDVDTRDWAHTPPATICHHILDTVQAGDIILMHDFIGHNSPTPEALRLVIPELLARGYRFVTVGELVDGAE